MYAYLLTLTCFLERVLISVIHITLAFQTPHRLQNTSEPIIKMPLLHRALLHSRDNGIADPAEPEVDYDLQIRTREMTVVEIVMTVVLTFLAGAVAGYFICDIVAKKQARLFETAMRPLATQLDHLRVQFNGQGQLIAEVGQTATDALNRAEELARGHEEFGSFRQDFVNTVAPPEPQPGE